MHKLILTFFLAGLSVVGHVATTNQLNIVFITADDMNYDSAGVYGEPIKDLTPNLDRLATQGMRFEYAYSTVAVCQPVRQIMQTGTYPHQNGSMGFFPIKPEVHTLNEQLLQAGYLISMFGKNNHHKPFAKFYVDYPKEGVSRHPSKLAEETRKFLRMAREQGKPFFIGMLMGELLALFLWSGISGVLALNGVDYHSVNILPY